MKWMDHPWGVSMLWISVSPSGPPPAFPLWTDRSESQPLSEGRALLCSEISPHFQGLPSYLYHHNTGFSPRLLLSAYFILKRNMS